jgi:hypothetical protein
MGDDPPQGPNPAGPAPNPGLASQFSPVPGAVGPSDIGTPASTIAMPALPVLPASTGAGSGSAPAIDASNYRKFYTITAELRQTYDTNVNTVSTHPQTAWETSITPSILVDFPLHNSEFTASASFGLTEYIESAGAPSPATPPDTVVTPGLPPPANPSTNPKGTESLQTSGQLSMTFTHSFSSRFNLTASDALVDSIEPNLFGTTGTLYSNGQNISNGFNAGLSSQWTPLFGTQTTYSNTIVRYFQQEFSQGQDSLENTASQAFSFAILPKISLSFGGVFDTISYDNVSRGYTSTTGFVGAQYQFLPSVSLSARVGASDTQSQQSISATQTSTSSTIAPYADLSASWQIGQRSSLAADYSHEVTPTDQVGANGQESDRLGATFTYQFNPRLTAHFQTIYTYAVISNSLINSNALSSYSESDFAVDSGMAYHFDKYFDANFDITASGVSSQISLRDYTREEFSIGLRGTY